MMSGFSEYLKDALHRALSDEANATDGGEFRNVMRLCRQGVAANHSTVSAAPFMVRYLWCVGSTQKRYGVRLRYWDDQVALFRGGDHVRIASEASKIWEEWQKRKCYLGPKTVRAVIDTAEKVVGLGWNKFKEQYLRLPDPPDTESLDDWASSLRALRGLKEVGSSISWYLVRNLYGAPFFKPDLHIMAIAHYFFGDQESPLEAMSAAVRNHWPALCEDRRLIPVHLGEIDYILWWYRQLTGLPNWVDEAFPSCG